jgi:hypothetical protein
VRRIESLIRKGCKQNGDKQKCKNDWTRSKVNRRIEIWKLSVRRVISLEAEWILCCSLKCGEGLSSSGSGKASCEAGLEKGLTLIEPDMPETFSSKEMAGILILSQEKAVGSPLQHGPAPDQPRLEGGTPKQNL